MTSSGTDHSRRRFLTAATTVLGGVGSAFVAVPFIGSWLPSAKTQGIGAPIDVDISKLEAGNMLTLLWRGKPIFVLKRTPEALASLPKVENELRDPASAESEQPAYAQNEDRSIKPDILVVIGVCTHLGCVPSYRPEVGSVEPTWDGGFFCPCHGSKYDLAGRVYKGVPAPLNLAVPPYRYVSDSTIRIGEDDNSAGAA